jgi:hypothetical protein
MPAKLIEQASRPRLAVEAAPKSAAHPREESPATRHDDIARLAYERFLEHGAQHNLTTGSKLSCGALARM